MDSTSYTKLPSDEKDIESHAVISEDGIYPIKSCKTRKCKHRCKAKKCVKSCCKIIIKSLLVLFMLMAVVGSIVAYKAHNFVAREVLEWTVTEPAILPIVTDVSTSDLEFLKKEAKAFFEGIEHGKNVDDFVVSAATFNGFAANDHDLRGNLYGEMDENKFSVHVNWPMNDFPGGKGRYLVGVATLLWDPESSILHMKMQPENPTVYDKDFFDFKFYLTQREDKTLNLEMISGKFLEWTVPQDFIDEHINLVDDLYNCDCHEKDCKHMRKFVLGLEEISIERNQVVFHPRNKRNDGHRALEEMGLSPSNRPGWKFDYGRRILLGF